MHTGCMTKTTAASDLDARRAYYREYLDHGVHDVPSRVRRELVDDLAQAFIASVHDDIRRAAVLVDGVKTRAAEHGLHFDR